MNDNTYNDILFVFLRELRRTILEVKESQKGLTSTQLNRVYGRLVTECGGVIAANRFLLDILDKESESITNRGFAMELIANASKFVKRMASEFRSRLESAFKNETTPFIKVGIAYSFCRWGDYKRALDLLNILKREDYKCNIEIQKEIDLRLKDISNWMAKENTIVFAERFTKFADRYSIDLDDLRIRERSVRWESESLLSQEDTRNNDKQIAKLLKIRKDYHTYHNY